MAIKTCLCCTCYMLHGIYMANTFSFVLLRVWKRMRTTENVKAQKNLLLFYGRKLIFFHHHNDAKNQSNKEKKTFTSYSREKLPCSTIYSNRLSLLVSFSYSNSLIPSHIFVFSILSITTSFYYSKNVPICVRLRNSSPQTISHNGNNEKVNRFITLIIITLL